MQLSEFNEIRMDIGKKIKKVFGNKIKNIVFYDIVEEVGHWSFKISFFAYDYFFIIFSYELDIIGFSIEIASGKLLRIIDNHNCYSDTDMNSYIQEVMKSLELRIPDKYLAAKGWI